MSTAGGYLTRGGIGGADFSLAELERAVGTLAAAALRLQAASDELDGSWPALGRILASDPLFAYPVDARLRRASLATRVEQAELTAFALAVRSSREVYERVEAEVERRVNELRGHVPVLLLNYAAESPGPYPSTRVTEDVINQSPALLGMALPLLFPSAFPVAAGLGRLRDRRHGGDFDTTVAERLYPQLAGAAQVMGWVRIGPVQVRGATPGRTVPFGGDLEAVMELQRLAEMDRAGHGALGVATVPTPRGRVHVVSLPGTQPQAPGQLNPWDTGGVVEAAGLGSQHTAAAVLEALERVGAEPGEALVFTGYSQGGIHAANLAADRRINGIYDVEHVVTVGSPVGNIELPDGVRALHLEHQHDLVPGLDGAPNPDRAGRVTVYFADYAPGVDPASTDAGGFGPAHKLENYRHLAAALPTAGAAGIDDAAPDPVVVEAQAALGAVFAGAGTATVRTVQLVRSTPHALDRPGPGPLGSPTRPGNERERRTWGAKGYRLP
ncbi:lipase family protein [Zafaria sp. J156]|uniref:lipase family protein n=1 Tax=Zafaria sp. J156 TaxID=3116490 RepID=UPI002E79994B|nr:lipase family protein [Zafaria sp. J156]MEE1621012.1 lipase family protein [Zafaria sp. J156]